jgi:hypothetical protein
LRTPHTDAIACDQAEAAFDLLSQDAEFGGEMHVEAQRECLGTTL